MVNNIISSTQLYQAKSLMNLLHMIEPEEFDHFVVSILRWYEERSKHSVEFHEDIPTSAPNVFQLFEYTGDAEEMVINRFINSDTRRVMDAEGIGFELAEESAVRAYNDRLENNYPLMVSDVFTVLDQYKLFYMYQDDASIHPIYRNQCLKEVW